MLDYIYNKLILPSALVFVIALGLVLPASASGQEMPKATIHAKTPHGYWHSPSTWVEGRVPTKDDIVYIDVPIQMQHNPTVVRGLRLAPTGSVDGSGIYNRGYLEVSDFFDNHGRIGSNMFRLTLGGRIERLGSIGVGTVHLGGGELYLPEVVNKNLALSGDVTLGQSVELRGRFATNNRSITLATTSPELIFYKPEDKLIVHGTSTIRLGEVASAQLVGIDGVKAASSTVHLISPEMSVAGNIQAEEIHVHKKVTLDTTHLKFSGDVYIEPEGHLNGESLWVVHWFEIDGDLINRGRIGPHVHLHLWGSLHNYGSYSNIQDLILRGDGERNFIGSIPRTVVLKGDQIWRSAPTLHTLYTQNNTITLPQGVGLNLSNSYDTLQIVGSGVVNYLDSDAGNPGGHIDEIVAPDARVVLAAAAEIGEDIQADILEIRNRLELEDSLRMQANQVAFIGGTLLGQGDRTERVEIDTPHLTGAGQFGSYLEAFLNTDIPRGFSAGWNTGVYLRHNPNESGASWRLASSTGAFLSSLADIVLDREPNLREAINSNTPHYYSYKQGDRWSDVWSINAEYNPFATSESIPAREFFEFGFIQHQESGEAFEVVLIADDETYDKTVRLSARRGEVVPRRVSLEDGEWQGEVVVVGSGKGEQLVATGLGTSAGYSGRSNYFGLSHEEAPLGSIRGVVRSAAGARVDYGLVEFVDKTTAEHESTPISADGSYQAQLPCGEYVVKAPGVAEQSIALSCGESVELDLVASRSCTQTDKVPVVLVPGIQGSDSNPNTTVIFPELLSYAPRWDAGELHLHDPFNSVGWNRLIEALEQEGYEQGCTIFAAPYDWAMSVEDSARQYLVPMIAHAKEVASSTQVDIVAHSMGGLVSRAYIQGAEYAGDVRRLAFVGTPNAGSALAYFSWEGGDTMAADDYGGNFFEDLFTKITQADQFQTKTTVKNHLIKTGSDTPLCQGGGPPYEYFGCDLERTKRFLRDFAPAVGELYPSYDFLYDYESGELVEPAFENKLLRALNGQECRDGDCGYSFVPLEERDVELRNFIGLEEGVFGPRRHTPRDIYVSPGDDSRYDYTDGAVKAVEQDVGDGTVLVDSVQAVEARSEFINDQHAELVSAMTDKIKNFLTQ